jgi:mRNA-degrading endonuclease YafQ of YafQ-DinJ toxin-antitoxin module
MRFEEFRPESDYSYILEEYSEKELFTFTLVESAVDGNPLQTEHWRVEYSNAFKKGLKKHANNPKVTQALSRLEQFIITNPQHPAIETYPPDLNVHPIKRDNVFAGAFSAHLVGRKIITLFRVEREEKTGKSILKFLHVGTHQEANPNWR